MTFKTRATVPHGTAFEAKELEITPNGRAETLILDKDGNEYELLEVYRPVGPLTAPGTK